MTETVETGGVRVETDAGVARITIDRPAQRNALDDATLLSLVEHAVRADEDPSVRAILIVGSAKVFAAGADVRALLERTPLQAYDGDRARAWARLRALSTPTVAAVSGFCLGGGCELAMMADVVVASETSRFGLPETQLGLIPGAGGTQFLPRAIGKAVAMDMVLTGRMLRADEALARGLVSRVTDAESWLDEAVAVADAIAARPAAAQRLVKEALLSAFETPLQAGIGVERRAFAMAFAAPDAREGMTAFVEKRTPEWQDR